MRSEIQTLLADPTYRDWFARWWAADFSIDGCQKRNIDWRLGLSRGFEQEFAGRRWGPGRLPPHDLNGDLNEEFFKLGWFDWDDYFIRARSMGRKIFDLDGAWFKRLAPASGAKITLAGRLSFVMGDVMLSSSNAASMKFRDAYIGGSLHLIDASITERAVFTRALIGGDVVLRQVSGSSIHLNRAKVVGSVSASDGVSEIDISDSEIGGQLVWNTSVSHLDAFRTRIQGAAILKGAPHNKARVRLGRASLGAGLTIDSAKLTTLDMRGARIIGDVATTSCDIETMTAQQLRVGGDLRQVGSNVQTAELRYVQVGGHLDWKRCTIGAAALTDAVISGGTAIEACTFNTFDAAVSVHGGSTSYLRTTFSDSVSFNGARFHGRTSFKGAAFRGRASFLKCRFDGSTSFAADRKDMPGFVEGGAGFDAVTFQTSRFTASKDQIWCVDFDGRQFEGASIFDGCRFFGSPRFFEVAFHEDASFRYTTFKRAPHPDLKDRWVAFQQHANLGTALRATLNSWNKGQQQYEHAYRSLKLRMSEIGAAREERRFLALELRARRARLDQEVRFLERLLSVSYDLASDYGEGIIRPLLWTAGITIGAAVAYHATAPAQVDWLHAVEFAVRQIFKPFNVWADGGAMIVPGRPPSPIEALTGQRPEGVNLGFGMKLVASAQSLGCLTLLFLSALAIRKRFRMS